MKHLLWTALLLALLGWGCASGDHEHGGEATHAEHEGHDEHEAADEHEGHAAHEGHDEHEGHAEPEEEHQEGEVHLSAAQIERAGIEVAVAEAGELHLGTRLTGTVELDADQVAHVVPKVAGVVREVRALLGDRVRRGQVLATIESRELADAKAGFLAARERLTLSEAAFAREEALWQKRISAEQDFLNARQALSEAKITLRSHEQQLHAIGLDAGDLKAVTADAGLTSYSIVSPLDGVVIAKHIATGEFFRDDHAAFTVADLSSVWVELDVYPKDLPSVRPGMTAEIFSEEDEAPLRGTVTYVGPMVSEETRTVPARIVLPNAEGRLRPGLFVTARIASEEVHVPVMIRRDALQRVEGDAAVFVRTDDGFLLRSVTVGRTDDACAEVLTGLEPGESYVTRGSFVLKAELGKAEAKHVH